MELLNSRNYLIALFGFLLAYPLVCLALFGAALFLNPFFVGLTLYDFGQQFGFIILVVYFFFLLKRRNVFFAQGFAVGGALFILYHFASLIFPNTLPPLGALWGYPVFFFTSGKF